MHSSMDNQNKIKIFIIENHRLFLEGMKQIIEVDPSLQVIAEANNVCDSLNLLKVYSSDVILLDVNAVKTDCLQEIKKLVEHVPKKNIILLLDQSNDINYIIRAVKFGVKGFLLKDMDDLSFINAIKAVYQGRFWLHPNVSHNLVEEYQKLNRTLRKESSKRDREYHKPLHIFTKRECEVLDAVVKGKNNHEVGETLGITESTVKSHVRNIMKKMHVNDRTNAVVMAIQNGWVELDTENKTVIRDKIE